MPDRWPYLILALLIYKAIFNLHVLHCSLHLVAKFAKFVVFKRFQDVTPIPRQEKDYEIFTLLSKMFPPKSNSWHRSTQFSQFRPVVQGAGCIPEGCLMSADAGAAKIEVGCPIHA